nr:hypothetical protein [Acetobacter okinawensis]
MKGGTSLAAELLLHLSPEHAQNGKRTAVLGILQMFAMFGAGMTLFSFFWPACWQNHKRRWWASMVSGHGCWGLQADSQPLEHFWQVFFAHPQP